MELPTPIAKYYKQTPTPTLLKEILCYAIQVT